MERFNKNKVKIEIEFIGKLWLAESNAKDFNELVLYIIENNQKNDIDLLDFQNAMAIHNALKYNIEIIPKFRFIKRWRMTHAISVNNLLSKLGKKEIIELATKVSELEGLSKKKTV